MSTTTVRRDGSLCIVRTTEVVECSNACAEKVFNDLMVRISRDNETTEKYLEIKPMAAPLCISQLIDKVLTDLTVDVSGDDKPDKYVEIKTRRIPPCVVLKSSC